MYHIHKWNQSKSNSILHFQMLHIPCNCPLENCGKAEETCGFRTTYMWYVCSSKFTSAPPKMTRRLSCKQEQVKNRLLEWVEAGHAAMIEIIL